jgi:hypothetical protein
VEQTTRVAVGWIGASAAGPSGGAQLHRRETLGQQVAEVCGGSGSEGIRAVEAGRASRRQSGSSPVRAMALARSIEQPLQEAQIAVFVQGAQAQGG